MVWNIVSDSSCDLQSRDFSSDRVRFELVPLRIQVGEREFVDNDDLVVPDLLAAMAEEKSASSTACPSPEAFARAFALAPSLDVLEHIPVRAYTDAGSALWGAAWLGAGLLRA